MDYMYQKLEQRYGSKVLNHRFLRIRLAKPDLLKLLEWAKLVSRKENVLPNISENTFSL